MNFDRLALGGGRNLGGPQTGCRQDSFERNREKCTHAFRDMLLERQSKLTRSFPLIFLSHQNQRQTITNHRKKQQIKKDLHSQQKFEGRTSNHFDAIRIYAIIVLSYDAAVSKRRPTITLDT